MTRQRPTCVAYYLGQFHPTAENDAVVDVFAIVSAGASVELIVRLTAGDVVVPLRAVAVLVTPPPSTSACIVE